MQKYNEYKKEYEKDQQTINSFDKFYAKFSQGNVIDKNEYEFLCKISTKKLEETRIESFFFINMNIKIKLIFLILIKY